jgi:xanthine/uracil permease
MSDETPAIKVSRPVLWAGYIVSTLPVLMLLMGAGMSLAKLPEAVKGTEDLGWPEHLMVPLAVTKLICVVIYLIPKTAVLGAILLTGYLGGAVAAHVRISDPFFAPIIVGVLLWIGLYLREPRLRALVPFR